MTTVEALRRSARDDILVAVPRNVEIKARIHDVEAQAELAGKLSDGDPEMLEQEDVFFNVPRGRLKLRILSRRDGQLIFYQRPDRAGPKTSTYTVVRTDRPRELEAILAAAYGIRNAVKKTRRLYHAGRTRIHIDRVESLGDFLELEVVLADSEDASAGEREALELMKRLGISSSQLVGEAYVDLLEHAVENELPLPRGRGLG